MEQETNNEVTQEEPETIEIQESTEETSETNQDTCRQENSSRSGLKSTMDGFKQEITSVGHLRLLGAAIALAILFFCTKRVEHGVGYAALFILIAFILHAYVDINKK